MTPPSPSGAELAGVGGRAGRPGTPELPGAAAGGGAREARSEPGRQRPRGGSGAPTPRRRHPPREVYQIIRAGRQAEDESALSMTFLGIPTNLYARGEGAGHPPPGGKRGRRGRLSPGGRPPPTGVGPGAREAPARERPAGSLREEGGPPEAALFPGPRVQVGCPWSNPRGGEGALGGIAPDALWPDSDPVRGHTWVGTGGAPTAAGWGEDCRTGPPISPPGPRGSAPSHCSDTDTVTPAVA